MRAETTQLVFLLGCHLLATAGLPLSPSQPLATVAGQPIHEQDLLFRLRTQLHQLRNQEYEVKRRALEELVNEKLLEAEGKKRGISAGKLVEQEADSKVAEPTEAEIEAFYFGQRDRLNRPLADVKSQLQQSLSPHFHFDVALRIFGWASSSISIGV